MNWERLRLLLARPVRELPADLASGVSVSEAYATGTPVAVGAVAAGPFGLLAANGLHLLYWSTTFDAA